MGILRIYLAISVIALHAGGGRFFFLDVPSGFLAVQFFFMISGFYMALVLNTKYSRNNNSSFLTNRFLKIFPAYWVSIMLSIGLSLSALSNTINNLTVSSQLYMVMQNIVLIGQDVLQILCVKDNASSCSPPSLIGINGPAWSLSVELIFYIFAPYLLRSVNRVYALIIVGILYHVALRNIELPSTSAGILKKNELIQFSYNLFPSSFIYFGIGALVYFMSTGKSYKQLGILVSLVFPLSYISEFADAWIILLFALTIPILFSYTKQNRFDRKLGELSYFIYVFHFPILQFIKLNEMKMPYLSLGELSTVVTLLFSIVYKVSMDDKIQEKFRKPEISSNSKILAKRKTKSQIGAPSWLENLLAFLYLSSPVVLLVGLWSL